MHSLRLVTHEAAPEVGGITFVFQEGCTVLLTRRSGWSDPKSLAPAPVGSRSILIVEDDPVMARTLRRSLRGDGLDVTVCYSCEEVDHLEQGFDTAIFDLHLPDGGGLQLAERLSGRIANLVFYSATNDIESMRRAIEMGVFVNKVEGLAPLRRALGLGDSMKPPR